jgi:hypothetical protein
MVPHAAQSTSGSRRFNPQRRHQAFRHGNANPIADEIGDL